MIEIPLLNPREAPRARRWDALILGSGIPALVAAARIGAAGQRVLVVEEEARSVPYDVLGGTQCHQPLPVIAVAVSRVDTPVQCRALGRCGAVPARMNWRRTSQNSLVAVNIGKCPLPSKG